MCKYGITSPVLLCIRHHWITWSARTPNDDVQRTCTYWCLGVRVYPGRNVVWFLVLVTSTHHCAVVTTCYWEDQLNISASPLWVDVHTTPNCHTEIIALVQMFSWIFPQISNPKSHTHFSCHSRDLLQLYLCVLARCRSTGGGGPLPVVRTLSIARCNA